MQLKLPWNKQLFLLYFYVDEGPESSIEDISRPYSPSLSSSNEDILKPTARIGERGDCELTEHRLNTQNDWLLRSGLCSSESNYQQYGAGSKLNSIDLAYLKDLDLSSTTESPSTLAAANGKEVESSTSFEYQENNLIRSPFQREIQRLLDSSASKVSITANRPTISAIDVHNSNASRTNAPNAINDVHSSFHSKQSNIEREAVQMLLLGGENSVTSTVNGKHSVGLEVIKEIAKNTANLDTSQM